MKSTLRLSLLLSLFLTLSLSAAETKKATPNVLGAIVTPQGESYDTNRSKLVGNILKNALEAYHYSNAKIDDKMSSKSFDQFIEMIDYNKQFFLKSDVEALNKYRNRFDDQMVSGKVEIVDQVLDILTKRIRLIENYRKEFFKGSISFNENEYIELDPKKRDFVKNEDELKDLWRKLFKQSVLTRYMALVDEQNDDGKDKKKNEKKEALKKKEKKKKLTDTEMHAKAKEAIAKKYEKLFSRLLKDGRDDYVENFFNSITTSFDPHTNYLAPKRKEDFDIDISGSLEGIGAVLQEEDSYIKVVTIVPGGAAWRQKDLEVGDLIISVGQSEGEPVDLIDMKVDDAVRYIRGKKGTEVRLTVKKTDGTVKTIPIVRDVVEIAASFAKSSVVENKNLGIRIGYIYLPKFYRDFSNDGERKCSDDVRREVEKLKKANVDGIILDLRNNGGGALEDARQMAGLFIDQGPVVQIRDHEGKLEVLRDTDPAVVYSGPLVVMTNMFSASASEIVAAAMQDYGRAVVVGGEYSHGKGTVQAVLNLNNGPLLSMFGPALGALKVTIQKFYRITGASTQFKGVTPDLVLPDPMSYTKSREKELDNALPWDEIARLSYTPWPKPKYDLAVLKKRSLKRVEKDERLQKIVKSVNYLTKKRDETRFPLNLVELKKQDDESKKLSEELKKNEQNKDILVSNYEDEDTLKMGKKIRKGDEKKWQEDIKRRKEEWVEGLQKDAQLGETLFVMKDMISAQKGEVLVP